MSSNSGGSRLDKLIGLLETGSSAATRSAAAEQIAAYVSAHPSQLPQILRKVQKKLRSQVWEARTAAGECLGQIAAHCRHHSTDALREAAGGDGGGSGCGEAPAVKADPDAGLLSFQGFSVAQVLVRGTTLLSSGGQEYDLGEDAMDVAKQRKRLRKRLGLDGQMEDLVDTRDLVKDEDLVAAGTLVKKEEAATQQASELLSQMDGLSARERARMKRLAKKRPAVAATPAGGGGKRKKCAAAGPAVSEEEAAAAMAQLAEQDAAEWTAVEAGAWPLQRLADDLCADLVDPTWHLRHGAAVGLRAILRSHAACAAVTAPTLGLPTGWLAAEGEGAPQLGTISGAAAAAASAANLGWLEDCIVRIVCVLALDRFADFVSDQVVAPVRDTAAQALGAAAQPLPAPVLLALVQQVAILAGHPQWEVRHSGLLALKYVVAARPDAAGLLLKPALDIAQTGLQDADDDVRAVAASALLPLAPSLIADGQQEAQSQLHDHLWDILLDSDELSPATGTAMQLLSHTSTAATTAHGGLSDRLSRLLPYFRHTLSSVRRSVLQCLLALLEADPSGAHGWLQGVLSSVLRLVFQNLLQEQEALVAATSRQLWASLLRLVPPAELAAALPCAIIQGFLALGCTPEGASLSLSALLVIAPPQSHRSKAPQQGAPRRGSKSTGSDRDMSPFVVGSSHTFTTLQLRNEAGTALGHLATALGPHAGDLHAETQRRLCTASGHDRIVASITAASCALASAEEASPGSDASDVSAPALLPAETLQLLHTLLVPGSAPAFSELSTPLQRVRALLAALVRQCSEQGVALPALDPPAAGLPDVAAVLGVVQSAAPGGLPASQPLAEASAALAASEAVLATTVSGCVAAAVVAGGPLPAKLNTIIQPLMGSLRKEGEAALQARAARAVATLLQASASRTPSPNNKVVSNICTMACSDPAETPSAAQQDPPLDAVPTDVAAKMDSAADEDPARVAAAIARRGAEAAIQAAAKLFGSQLPQRLPRLWELATAAVLERPPGVPLTSPPTADPQAVINALQVFSAVGPALHESLLAEAARLLPAVGGAACHSRAPVRAAAAAAAASLTAVSPAVMLPELLRFMTPMLRSDAADVARLSAVNLARQLVQRLAERLVPYLQLLVVPLMARMSDPLPAVRTTAAPAFAAIVALVPLAQGTAMPDGLDESQQQAWIRDAAFLAQLQDSGAAKEVAVPAALGGVQMRPYQREGLAWLAFLRRSGLHGVLADDMGLGKTLQATSIMAAALEERAAAGEQRLPCLVVCPQTLVLHWAHEVHKFAADAIRTVAYHGSPTARAALRGSACEADLVVMSYETLRGDADWAASRPWLYAVLDEGHTIRNPKSKIAQACRAVVASHRVILSGTPIQNSIGELWGLFDWLMPGFLGTEKDFQAKHGKALQAARTSKRGSREAEAALLSLDSLHKQIKPFVLRRTKDQVLKDLPPKILQDVFVNPSPLQAQLLEDLAASSLSAEIAGSLAASGAGSTIEAAPHVFQALQYMRKVCSHPALVLDQANAAHQRALATQQLSLPLKDGPLHAPKLGALRELLGQCGIGSLGTEAGSGGGEAPQHRVLIFAQLRAFLDLVQNEVLAPAGITWLRLDGGVEAGKRFGVVQQFNADPSIDVMLLTTAVGGLGLNLTSADTVIFLEHDWNPMKDLQAMDRAHRLGQRRTVNVYRLLVRGTLEEHIMGLQRFKLDVAGAVVNQDNVSVATMDTGKLLDLFTPEADKAAPSKQTAGGPKDILQNLDALWDDSQYDELNSIDDFVTKLGS